MQMSHRSIDVVPVVRSWMNYVTASVDFKGGCAGEKSVYVDVVTTHNTTPVFTHTVPCKSSVRMHTA